MAVHTKVADWLTIFGAKTEETDWNAVYAHEMPRIYNFFRYRVGQDVAEDLTATTFEKAWRARARYNSDIASFSTWLFTIARNVATDHLRKRREFVSLEAIHHMSDGGTPEDAALRRAEFARLTTLFAKLSDRERDLISLKYGAGMTNRAIAETTGLSESNVGTILHRVIAGLRNQWEAASQAGAAASKTH
jgi:RNA polymerase sigma-70 factor (ECF subfamily)